MSEPKPVTDLDTKYLLQMKKLTKHLLFFKVGKRDKGLHLKTHKMKKKYNGK